MADVWKSPSVLTIAGVDSSGGAGVAADLKTFASLKFHGACVVTALTAQNTRKVYEVHPTPPGFLKRQLEAVFSDLEVKAVKVGMLYAPEAVKVVAYAIRGRELAVVVDPVLRAAVGDSLAAPGVVEAYTEELLPLATVVTPNIPEAEVFTNMKIKSFEDMKAAVTSLHEQGAEAILLKGGHLGGEIVVDLLSQRQGRCEKFERPRIKVEPHGIGCALSAALAVHLAQGYKLPQAVRRSEEFIDSLLSFCKPIGGGLRVADPLVPLYNEAERQMVVESIRLSLEIVKAHETKFLPYIAEVGTQIAMSLPYPTTLADVAAVDGRLKREACSIKISGSIKFGVSSHMARLILTCIHRNPTIRAAMNLHYEEGLLRALEKAGLTVSAFDRSLEPVETKQTEGATIIWGVERAVRVAGRVTDVIYDLGETGKEPMIRILGRNAEEVVEKALRGINLRGI
ncbi:MAG: bifunctional hydroxymethylpyrimidine kinase/phosphomethylpyrimidine kinase [Candidatus Bathyarchaeia archaeon]